jgi:lysozyme
MKTNQAGRELIKRFEGCRLKAYQCSAGKWTIGWGSTSNAREGMEISQERADTFFELDLMDFEWGVDRLLIVDLNENQYSALVSFAYNVGLSAFAGSTLLRMLNHGLFDEAAEQFLKWTRAGGKILPGLVARRAAERELFLTPINEETT